MYKEPSWDGTSTLADAIRELGPAAYQTFPAHHFFARVYRPSAVSIRTFNDRLPGLTEALDLGRTA